MKSNSGTVLVSIAGIIVAIALMVGAGFAIARRIGGRDVIARETRVEGESTTSDSMIFDLSGFSAIESVGGWTVNIRPGADYSVRVDATERALAKVRVSVSGETLRLELASGVQSVTGRLTANITMPDLERIGADGAANIDIRDFDLDRLDLEVNGATSISASGGSIGDLDLDSDGAASFDFSATPVTNARISMDGASNLSINMNGGDLTGSIDGVGRVSYSGSVSEESIRVDGLGSVRQN